MKKLNVYSVYLDDGKDVFRVTVPAASKKDAAEYVRGNGDVVAIKPADLQDIDLDALADTLKRAQWGQMEIDIITRRRCCCRRAAGIHRGPFFPAWRSRYTPPRFPRRGRRRCSNPLQFLSGF